MLLKREVMHEINMGRIIYTDLRNCTTSVHKKISQISLHVDVSRRDTRLDVSRLDT